MKEQFRPQLAEKLLVLLLRVTAITVAVAMVIYVGSGIASIFGIW